MALNLDDLTKLTVEERLAFKVAADMVSRDRNPGINTTVVLIMTIERLISSAPEASDGV